MPTNTQISIFTGHFGSGKTEMAINYAIKKKQEGKDTILIDIDIVNPFFRSTEIKEILNEKGIELISPTFATTNMDLPALPAAIYGVFERKNTEVIFDVGGDEDGASVLGRYKPYIENKNYNMHFVINTLRPFTQDTKGIINMAEQIEKTSRLKINSLINNTNLSYETNIDHILNGQKIVRDVSNKMKLPITYIGVKSDLINQLPEDCRRNSILLDVYMKPSWQKE